MRGRACALFRHGSLPCADAACAPQFLGWYNPLKKETQLDAPNIKKWLDQGAQPTETVANLLKKAMIMEQKGPKRVFNQLSTKAAAAAKAEKAAALKKAQNAKAEKAKAKAAAEGAFPRQNLAGLRCLWCLRLLALADALLFARSAAAAKAAAAAAKAAAAPPS